MASLKQFLMIACAGLVVTSCATLSPRARLKDQFVELGFSRDRASCLADELDERLDRDDLSDVADFVASLNEAATPGEGLDALLGIDNPRAARAIASSGLACAF